MALDTCKYRPGEVVSSTNVSTLVVDVSYDHGASVKTPAESDPSCIFLTFKQDRDFNTNHPCKPEALSHNTLNPKPYKP